MVNTNSIEKLITYQFNRENPFRPNYNTASEVIPDINMHEEKKSGIHGKLIYISNIRENTSLQNLKKLLNNGLLCPKYTKKPLN